MFRVVRSLSVQNSWNEFSMANNVTIFFDMTNSDPCQHFIWDTWQIISFKKWINFSLHLLLISQARAFPLKSPLEASSLASTEIEGFLLQHPPKLHPQEAFPFFFYNRAQMDMIGYFFFIIRASSICLEMS